MQDNPMNPKGWIPNPGAVPPSMPPVPPPPAVEEEEYDDDDIEQEQAMGDDPLEDATGENDAGDGSQEEDSAEPAVSGPSFAARFKTLAAAGGASCLQLAKTVSARLAKLPAALRKKKTDDPGAESLPGDAALTASSDDPTLSEDPDAEPEPVSGGFLKTRSSRIQAAAFVSTGLLTAALVVHNVMKSGKPSPAPNDTAATKPESKKGAKLARVEAPPVPVAEPEPKPEPEPTVVADTVAPPPTAIAAAPPTAMTPEPPPAETAPPEPVAAVAVDPLVPDLPAVVGAEPPPMMPALPASEDIAAIATEGAGPDLPPPLAPEAPAMAAAPENDPAAIAAPEPIAAASPSVAADKPPALAATPTPTPTPAPEPAPAGPELPPTLPDPTAMAAAPALAIPSLAPPPDMTPEPSPAVVSTPVPAPEPAPIPEPAPVVVAAPEPAPIAAPTPVEPPAEPVAVVTPQPAPSPAPTAFDASELKPLPNAGRRVLTMGTPIGGPLPIDTIAASAATAASLTTAASTAAAVPISAESFQVEHVVQSGENFWTISRLYYGSGRFYKALWKANARTVKAPDALVVGNTIVVPPPESLDRTLIEPPGGNIASTGRSTVRDPSTHRAAQGPDGSITLPIGRSTALAESVAALEPEAPRPSHIVRGGETLRSIARDRLGNARRESEIRQLNLDVIADDQPVVGQRLRLPNDATATQLR